MIVSRRNGADRFGYGDRNRIKASLGIDLGASTPEARLAEFVALGRATQRRTFGGSDTFDQRRWFVLEHEGRNEDEVRRRKANQSAPALWFTQTGSGTKAADRNPDLLPPFRDFAKALIRLRNEVKEAGASKHQKTISVLRYLHDTVATPKRRPDTSDPTYLDRECFERALREMSVRGVSEGTLYVYGQELEAIAAFLDRYELTECKIDYRNKAPVPVQGVSKRASTGTGGARGQRADTRSHPIGDRTWTALGQIHRLLIEDGDKIRMAVVIMLAVGGWRINEVLGLAADLSFLDAPSVSNGKPIPLDTDVRDQTIWVRYRLSKEDRWHEKPLPRAAAELVWNAYREVRRISTPARETAKFMHDNPGQALLPPAWRHLDRDSLVPLSELRGNLLIATTARAWMKTHEVTAVERHGGEHALLGDIERALLKQQATGIPGSPFKLHELLFIMPLHLCFKDRQPKPHVVEVLDENQIANFLVGTGEKSGVRSVFERFPLTNADGSRLTEEDGSEIRISTHQFRHHVSTEAIRHGSGHFALAGYFGRKSIAPNRAYVHLTEAEKMRMARDAFGRDAMDGPMASAIRLLPAAEQDEIRGAIALATIKTDIGLCVHDWSILPCPHDGQCGSCPESFVRKGDPEQRDRARELLAQHSALVDIAEKDGGPAAASNHLRHHRRMVLALREVMAVHDDASRPDGTLVQVVSAGRTSLGLDRGAPRR